MLVNFPGVVVGEPLFRTIEEDGLDKLGEEVVDSCGGICVI